MYSPYYSLQLLSLNYINETMYYWGVNSKMQTSHTLCSRPKRYGALHRARVEVLGTHPSLESELCLNARAERWPSRSRQFASAQELLLSARP